MVSLPEMEYTPVPNYFLSNLLPEMMDIAELKVVLHIFGCSI